MGAVRMTGATGWAITWAAARGAAWLRTRGAVIGPTAWSAIIPVRPPGAAVATARMAARTACGEKHLLHTLFSPPSRPVSNLTTVSNVQRLFLSSIFLRNLPIRFERDNVEDPYISLLIFFAELIVVETVDGGGSVSVHAVSRDFPTEEEALISY